MCPCVTITASTSLGLTGSGTLLSAVTSAVPWKSPQSMKTCRPSLVSKCLLPVTVPAAPTNVSSATRFLQNAGAVESFGARHGARAVRVQTAVHQLLRIVVGDDYGSGTLAHHRDDTLQMIRDAARIAWMPMSLPS